MKGLDKWLTTDPRESLDSWYENITEGLSQEAWDKHETYILHSNDFYTLCDTLSYRGCTITRATEILERILRNKK
jgi:hypothetical protein